MKRLMTGLLALMTLWGGLVAAQVPANAAAEQKVVIDPETGCWASTGQTANFAGEFKGGIYVYVRQDLNLNRQVPNDTSPMLMEMGQPLGQYSIEDKGSFGKGWFVFHTTKRIGYHGVFSFSAKDVTDGYITLCVRTMGPEAGAGALRLPYP